MIPEYFALRTVKYGAPFFAELLKEFGNTSMPLISYIYISSNTSKSFTFSRLLKRYTGED